MAEQWAFNPLVQGSTPWRPTGVFTFSRVPFTFGPRRCRRNCPRPGPEQMRPASAETPGAIAHGVTGVRGWVRRLARAESASDVALQQGIDEGLTDKLAVAIG